MKTVIIVFVSLLAGSLIGGHLVQSDIISEVNQWHTAKMYEDGSYIIEYQDGTITTGCIETGLCQD